MSNLQQTMKIQKRSSLSSAMKYNYIQTEPDEMETNQEDEFVRDENYSDKQQAGQGLSDVNFNENQYNDKPQQIPKIQSIKQGKNIIKTLPVIKIDDKKQKALIKTKVTKFYIEEQKKLPKVGQYKTNSSHPLKTVEKPVLTTHRVKNTLIKKTIDLNNSNDKNSEVLYVENNQKQSLYDKAIQSISKSTQKNQTIKSLKTDLVGNCEKILNSERQIYQTAIRSLNLKRNSIQMSDDQYESPQKAGSVDFEMDEQNSDIVVNKFNTQSIGQNKIMRMQDIKLSVSKKLKPQNFKIVSVTKNPVSPLKNSGNKSKAQKPVMIQKTNSNNIGQLHNSQSNKSLSINHSLRIIPKSKPIVKKVEIKKTVQFESKPMPKKGKFAQSMNNNLKPMIVEEQKSSRNSLLKKELKPKSPSGPNNQQKTLNFESGNNQDRVFIYEEEKEKSTIEQLPLTQRFSMNYNNNYNDFENLSILKKNSSIRSPINIQTKSITLKNVNMIVEQSFSSVPKKLELPIKPQVMLSIPSGTTDSRKTQNSRRDRSQTLYQPSSFNAGELQLEAKTHRLDKLQPKVNFQEQPLEIKLCTSNLSITSAGIKSNGSGTVRELFSLKQMRDQKKNSKSLLKFHGFTSNQSETDGDKLVGKLAEIQNQLNQLSELSAQDRGSNHGSWRRLRSTSLRKPGHSTSQRELIKEGCNLSNFANGPPAKSIVPETPQPSRFQMRMPAKNAFSNYNSNVVEPIQNLYSITKKVMIDLSTNPDCTRNFNPSISEQCEIDEDYGDSIHFVENFKGNQNVLKKSNQSRHIHTTMQQPTMMSGGYSSYQQQPSPLIIPRTSSKSCRRSLQKHDSMTEKLSREILQQINPQHFQSEDEHIRGKSEKQLYKSSTRQSSSQKRIPKGNLLFQKKQGSGVNFKLLQNQEL